MPGALEDPHHGGHGVFTDAYDLFIIGVAAVAITADWHIAGYQKSLLSSLALLTSAAGAVFFGRIADKLGRRKRLPSLHRG